MEEFLVAETTFKCRSWQCTADGARLFTIVYIVSEM